MFSPADWPLPPDVDSLVLLHERGQAVPESGVEAPAGAGSMPAPESESALPASEIDMESAPPMPVDEPVVALPQCHTIGPFMSRETQGAVARLLKRNGLDAKQRTSDVQEQIGYWVYLPAMSAAEAKRVADRLSRQGLSDYFIGRQNYISLGAFSDKRAAEARRRRVADMGYEPRLDPRFRIRTVYWLDVVENGEARLTEERWSEIHAAYPEARRQSLSCE
jgi:hypothetical protein